MRFVFALSLVFFLSSLSAAEPPKHTEDSIDTIKKHLADGKALLIDVREKREWDAGRLHIARLLPLSKLHEDKTVAEKELDKEKIIYTHCKSGGRSRLAAEILAAMGYDVRPLKHGYEDLLEAGFKKAKPQK